MTLKRLLLLLLVSSACLAKANNSFAIKTVVIDAGHGGRDPGAIGPDKINEKDVALAVALKFGEYLKKNFPDLNIIYTRKTDVFLELHERSDIANQNKADLFICIHCNSTNSSSVYGTSTYVLGLHRTEANLEVAKRENSVINLEDDRDKNYEFDPNSPEGHIIMSMKQNAFLDQSIDIASKIENEFETQAKRKSLGVKQAGFYVLYKTTMPSILSEIGFISNPTEERFLNSAKGQDQIAQSLLKAFKDYKIEMEHGESDQYPKNETAAKTANPSDNNSASGNAKNAEPNETSKTTSGVKSSQSSQASNSGNVKVEEPAKTSAAISNPDDAYTTLQNGKKIRKPIESSSGGGTAATENKPEPKPPVSDNTVVIRDTPPSKTSDNTSTSTSTKDVRVTDVPKTKDETSSNSSSIKVTDKPLGDKETVAVKSTPTAPPKKVESDKPKTTETITASGSAPKSSTPKPADVPPSEPTKGVTAKETVNGTIYKIQLFALKTDMKKSDRAILSKLYADLSTEELPSGVIRYYAGKSGTYSEAKKDLATATSHGYKDAFIVGFKDGVRMTPAQIKLAEGH